MEHLVAEEPDLCQDVINLQNYSNESKITVIQQAYIICTVAFSVLLSALTGHTAVLLCSSPGNGGSEIPLPVWILSLEQCL